MLIGIGIQIAKMKEVEEKSDEINQLGRVESSGEKCIEYHDLK